MSKPVATQAFWEAAASGDLAGVREQLKKGVDPLAVNPAGLNAVHCALANFKEDAALVLMGYLDRAADGARSWLTQEAKTTGSTLLHLAVSTHQVRAVKALLDLWADDLDVGVLTLSRQTGENPMHVAVRQGAVDLVSRLLAANPKALESPTAQGLPPLAVAVLADKPKVALLLIEKGARLTDPLSQPAWSKVASVAMLSALTPHVDWGQVRSAQGQGLLHALASRGAGVRTPLWRASLAAVSQAGQVEAQDDQGQTALHVAVRAIMPPDAVDLLIEHGAQWNTLDAEGLSSIDAVVQQVRAGAGSGEVDRWHAQAREQHLSRAYAPPRGTPSPRL